MKPTVEIVTPAPPGSLHGNRVTALRWQGFLEGLGFTVRVTESWSGKHIGLLIALHAYRSHRSILQFRDKYPDESIALILTGTDLYRDMAVHGEVLRSMELADKLIILQSSALDSIPPSLRHKAQVIYQSIQLNLLGSIASPDFQVVVIGHLREEKDPFCIARSLSLMPPDSQVHVLHLGKAMSIEMGLVARDYSAKLNRYQWLGEVSHADTLKTLSQSHLMVISSRMEGGAHVVSEAIALGIPVIASGIPGNRGLLGDDYPGYYPVGDEAALANLLYQVEKNPDFYALLKRYISVRKDLVSPDRERRSIEAMLAELIGK